MIIPSETIKNLRTTYEISQSQLAKAIYVENSTISQYENGKRIPSIEILEQIVNVFGYTIELNLIEKKNAKRDIHFFKEKSFDELKNMNECDLIDYIFISQSNEIIANVCNLDENILEYINLENLKNIIAYNVSNTDRLTLYFKLNKLYKNIEFEMSNFIKSCKNDLENFSNLDKEILDKIAYLDMEIEDSRDGYYYFSNIIALDKDKNELDINIYDNYNEDDIPMDVEIEDCVGKYLFDKQYFKLEDRIIKLYS